MANLSQVCAEEMHDTSQYIPGAPSQESREIDSSVCREAICNNKHCCHVGLRYRPFVHKDPEVKSYIVVAVCPQCKEAFAF